MTTPPTLVCTVGLPRAGKSTWARAQGVPVVNPDAIRLAICEQPFVASAEPYVWAVAKTMVKALFLAGHTRVILDATNVTRKRRAEWDSPAWNTCFKVFDTPDHECVRRAVEGNRNTLVAVIGRMAAQWEPLHPDEHRHDDPPPPWKSWALAENGWPRRRRTDLWTPAEKAIGDAIQAVENAGCHTLLTEAVGLLGDAQSKVADFVELPPPEPRP